MSFDLLAINGDVQISPKGDLELVTDTDKLAQDVVKLLNTTQGTDPLNIGYGSLLTSATLGSPMREPDSIVSEMQVIITEALDKLITDQEYQASYQELTDAETIIGFEVPVVEFDPQEPRQFNIIINALSRDLTPLTLAFVVKF